MAAFLHWVGRERFTRKSFIRQVHMVGLTRRFPPATLRDMDWGDEVYCMIRQRRKDICGVLFGYFPVVRLTGLSQEATKRLQERGLVGHCIEIGGRGIATLFEKIITGPTFEAAATIPEICQMIADSDVDLWPMLWGPFHELDQPAMMMDVPFALGFRPFDGEAFSRDYAKAILEHSEAGFVHLNGMYRPQEERSRKKGGKGEVGTVLRYQPKR